MLVISLGCKSATKQAEGCEYYWKNPEECGDHDTREFNAVEMCCACPGNSRSYQIHTYK